MTKQSNFTIAEIMDELCAFRRIDSTILARAAKSNITEKNHKGFRTLVAAYSDGKYDEDIPVLINELDNLMQQRL